MTSPRPRLTEIWIEGRRGWPDVALPEDDFVAYAAVHFAPIEADVPDDRARDLFLAAACARGDDAAAAAFQRAMIPVVHAAGRHLRSSPDRIAELTQELTVRFLVGDGEHGPKIREYAGRGSLRRWVRMAAVRAFLTAVRDARDEPCEDEVLASRIADVLDPELEFAKRRDAAQFRSAFAGAVAALSPRDRSLLRHVFVDRMTLERLAVVHGTSRSSAARWLERAVASLSAGVRSRLKEALGLETGEISSLYRWVASRLDVPLDGLLAAPVGADFEGPP